MAWVKINPTEALLYRLGTFHLLPVGLIINFKPHTKNTLQIEV